MILNNLKKPGCEGVYWSHPLRITIHKSAAAIKPLISTAIHYGIQTKAAVIYLYDTKDCQQVTNQLQFVFNSGTICFLSKIHHRT
jgi:hypothetical protein